MNNILGRIKDSLTRRVLGFALLGFLIGVGFAVIGGAAQASPITDNRGPCWAYGGTTQCRYKNYFSALYGATQIDDNGDRGYVLPRQNGWQPALYGATTKATFIALLDSYRTSRVERLYGPTAGIVNVMLGRNGDQANAAGGKFLSPADWTEFQKRLNDPAITMEYTPTYPTVSNTSGKQGGDMAALGNQTTNPAEAVVFRHSGTIIFVLEYNCANTLGNLPGLPLVPSNWSLTGNTTSTSPSPYPGQSVTFTSYIKNDSQGGTASFYYGPRYFYSSTPNPSRTASGAYSGEIATTGNASGTLAPNASVTGINQTVTVAVTASANYICGTVAFDPASSSGIRNGRSTARCYTINHPTLTCGVYTPTSVELGQAFPATATLTSTAADLSAVATYGSPSFFFRIYNSSGTQVYDAGSVPATRSGGTYTLSASPGGLVPAGHYTVQYGVNSALVNKSCSGAIDAAYKPFFTTTGGDIMSDGIIKSWNEDGGAYAGASSQLAALATVDITSFVTGKGLSSFGSGSGLAFANTTKVGTKYGGGYAVGEATIPSLPAKTPNLQSPINLGWDTITTNVYYRDRDLSLTGVLAAGKNVTIVLTSGNLYIYNLVIKYADYSNLSEIPRLTVIVQNGNIYVDNDVTEVHGVFYAGDNNVLDDATPGGKRGNFYSCATASGTPSTDYATCNNQLTVYGAVTANKLVLSRTHGSLHASGTTPAEPAENFFYSPEVWLAPSSTTSGSSSTIYNSYVSLPPIL